MANKNSLKLTILKYRLEFITTKYSGHPFLCTQNPLTQIRYTMLKFSKFTHLQTSQLYPLSLELI